VVAHFAFTSAFAASKARTTSKWPCAEAAISDGTPLAALAFTSAFKAMSVCTRERSPATDASKSAVVSGMLCAALVGGTAIMPNAISSITKACTRCRSNGALVFLHACKMGLEGIVSKRLTAPYRSGPSRDWCCSRAVRKAELMPMSYALEFKISLHKSRKRDAPTSLRALKRDAARRTVSEVVGAAENQAMKAASRLACFNDARSLRIPAGPRARRTCGTEAQDRGLGERSFGRRLVPACHRRRGAEAADFVPQRRP
jgi:hypothetical protein